MGTATATVNREHQTNETTNDERTPNSPDAAQIPEGTLRSVTQSFLGVGETVFDSLQATAVTSGYFKRSSGPRG